ncbi:MAG: hypothetical protein LBQ76_05010 [Candidatus Fibromonas sp.]|jgi:uncharacterized protein (TIGR02145 family)|nr:hypothetical protein [Candidatus Fibromonas sp.]
MKKLLLFVCVVLAILGCGGDMDDGMPCLTCKEAFPDSGLAGESSSSSVPSSDSSIPSSSSSISSSSVPSSSSLAPIPSPKPPDISNYKIIDIGTQTWMAENLNYAVEGSKCYDNLESYCDMYGRLYDWATAMALPSNCNSNICSSQIQSPHQGICPDDWHIPSQGEWDILTSYVRNSDCASCGATKLKAISGWQNGNGTNDYGFSALPGGGGSSWSDGDSFYNIGSSGFWWSASEDFNGTAYIRDIHYGDEFDLHNGYRKSNLYSVRCLRNGYGKSSSSSSFIRSSKGNNISNYRTVVIGTQTWMAENLDYTVAGSKCYDNDPAKCDEYGQLYDWATAMNLPSSCNSNFCSSQIQTKHRGICPAGWHIPDKDDWDDLINQVGGYETAGKHLKAKGGWNPYSGIKNLDTYDFSALPGGYDYSGGSFSNVGNYGYWWSASEYENNSYGAYNRYMRYNDDGANWDNGNGKSFLHSVRCLQD